MAVVFSDTSPGIFHYYVRIGAYNPVEGAIEMSYKPRRGGKYWMINSRFEVRQTENTGSDKSRKRIQVGNSFKTKEDAEQFKLQLMVGQDYIQFDKKIAFCYGLGTGAFIAAMICLAVLR